MPAPKGNDFARKDTKAKLMTIRLYPEDEDAIKELLSSGYAPDKNKAIRRALKDALNDNHKH